MSAPPDPGARPTLAQESGLQRPSPGWWAWAGDAHVVAALLLAVPVWAVLGLAAGPHLRDPSGGWAWASLVLVQPFAEELVFRGVLQGQLLRLSGGRRVGAVTLANLATTAGFVAMHLLAQPPVWALAVAVPSLVFGHLRERLGSVWPAVAMHAIYNAGFGLTAWLARS
jgi:membrane protease YdiL (CAAX protease family)